MFGDIDCSDDILQSTDYHGHTLKVTCILTRRKPVVVRYKMPFVVHVAILYMVGHSGMGIP